MLKYTAILLICLSAPGNTGTGWQPDFATAKQKAMEEHRFILLNFSGSDWCGPCIRLRKEILDAPEFVALADTSLELVNADFPRNKKNQLDKAHAKLNDALADQYNPGGIFPFTLLLTADGKPVHKWEGLPKETAAQFAAEIRSACDANKKNQPFVN
jgi:thiol-disulfide isomerase/thioredoxin